jgi:hypothetical protein
VAEDFDGPVEPALPLVDGHGMPIRIDKRGRGRPAFEKTAETQRLVSYMLMKGLDREAIAAALSCSVKTLERYFSPELKRAASARTLAEARNLDRLMAAAAKGNVSAMVQIDKKIEKWERGQLAERVAKRPAPAAPMGKKDKQKLAAQGVAGKFAPPPAPTLLN